MREALGWPIMVTPLSQFIGVQAFLNVTTGERWSQIPDEIVKYVLGQYWTAPGELDPEIEARALASPAAAAFATKSTGSTSEMLEHATATGSATRSCCCA